MTAAHPLPAIRLAHVTCEVCGAPATVLVRWRWRPHPHGEWSGRRDGCAPWEDPAAAYIRIWSRR